MCNTCVTMMEGVPTKILGQATLRHSTFIHYPLSIIIFIDGLYFPRLVNCFLLFYYLTYRARTFEFVTLQHQCICRVLKLPALSYIITNLPI